MTTALTGPAQRWWQTTDGTRAVYSRRELAALDISRHVIAGHVAARRWQRHGSAIVLHNGPLTRAQREEAALISAGPRSALTSFTALTRWGMTGWDRTDVHLLVPVGTRTPRLDGVVLHRVVDWDRADLVEARRLHRPAGALIVASTELRNPRHACAVLAAGVQQRLVTATALQEALERWPTVRHYRLLRLALLDIQQGAQALSELDFVALCRRHRLPLPRRQAVRIEPSGRRRYFDAEWDRPDGRTLVAEVDGAIHVRAQTWMDDQFAHNEIVLAGSLALRFPSVSVRCEEPVVVSQLRRGLLLTH